MSTRGAWGFISEGKEYITYNHCDSYPSGIGQALIADYHELGLAQIKTYLEKIKLINEDHKFTDLEIEWFKKCGYPRIEKPHEPVEDAYTLFRNIQADMECTLQSGYMIDNHSFLLDSLFCEWAYIFNLDTEMLEVYEGFQEKPHSKGRYSKLEPCDDKYYPVALIASFPLQGVHKIPFAQVIDLITTEQDSENEEINPVEKEMIDQTLKVFELSKHVAKKEV